MAVPGRAFAYELGITAGARTFAAVVARHVERDRVTTQVLVTAPEPLRGSVVRAVESDGDLQLWVRLSTMAFSRRITGAAQTEALPLVDIGYLDFIAAPHPTAVVVRREIVDGRCAVTSRIGDGDAAVEVTELQDADGRVHTRTVTARGRGRRWHCGFDEAEPGLPVWGVVERDGADTGTTFTRPRRAVALPEPDGRHGWDAAFLLAALQTAPRRAVA